MSPDWVTFSPFLIGTTTGPVKGHPERFSEFTHVTSPMLESVFVRKDQSDCLAFNYSSSHPGHRLPYLYSLAIGLSRGIRGADKSVLEVLLDLLEAPDEQQGTVNIKRISDPNVLTVNVLRRTLPRRPEQVVAEANLQT